MKQNKSLKKLVPLCIVGIIALPYFVQFLYWFGENFIGLPTYLEMKDMLSYLISALSLLASTFIGIVALWQTRRLDDMSRAPNIVISEVANNNLYNISEKFIEQRYGVVHKADGICGKVRFFFRVQILEKSIEEITISNFSISKLKNNRKTKILNFPDSTIPGDNFPPFLQANSQHLICYSTDKLESNEHYEAFFLARCKTMEGYCYEKKCHLYFVYSIYDCISTKPVEGSAWEKCTKSKKRKDKDHGQP